MTKRTSGVIAMTLLVVAACPAVAAEARDGQSTLSKAKQSALEWSDITASERARAESWGLSATEWDRYRSLMAGIRGSISPGTISPIEVLGIHARDDAERRRYAEQWAVMMREDAERILAFQRAYDQAGRLLYPGESLINVARLADRDQGGQALLATDRVLLFALPDCTACDAMLSRLLARLDRVAGVDVYLAGVAAGDEIAIRDWATARGIEPEWVRTRRVTLNFDGGALERLVPGQSELPYLMRRRGESVTPLPRSAL
jgi:integrating conjugative element protein (TIGR03759 family)